MKVLTSDTATKPLLEEVMCLVCSAFKEQKHTNGSAWSSDKKGEH